MQPNSNLSCIPFYESLEEQDFRKWYAYGVKYPHYVPSDFLVPFHIPVIKSNGNAWNIDSVEFWQVCCRDRLRTGLGSFSISYNDSFDLYGGGSPFVTSLISNGLVSIQTSASDSFDLIVYYAKPVAFINLPKGVYYLHIILSNNLGQEAEYYSDVFFVDTRESLSSRMIHLLWRNEEAIEYNGGRIPYGTDYYGETYRSMVFLDTEIGKPTYNFTEEGEERNGYFYPIKQISDKTFNMRFFAPEYLCDALRLVRMADWARITDKLGRMYYLEQFDMEVDWLEQGHYADVSCTFKTDTIVKKVGKAYSNINGI